MKTAPLVRTLLAGAALASCGGSQQTHTTTQNNAIVTQPAHAPEPPPDTSEVPRPDSVLAVVRVSSINQILDRVVQLSGMGEAVRAQANEAIAQMHNGLGAVIDENAPVDVLVAVTGHDDADAAIGFGAASMDDVERALANSHRLTLIGNGVRRIEREHHAAGDNSPDRDHGASRQQCVIAPTPDSHHTRIVCSSNASLLETMTPYEARTLTRTQVPADTINADVLLEPIRQHFAHDSIERIDRERQHFDTELAQSQQIVDPAVRQAVTTLAHDVFDALHGMIVDPTVFNASLNFNDQRVALHMGVDLHGPDGNLLRALFEAVGNPSPPPADVIAHLLPGGWMYSTMSMDGRPLRSTFQELTEIGNQLAAHHRTFDNADRTALRAALEGLNLLDPGSAAVSAGADDAGHMWFASTYHSATITPAQVITNARNTVAAMRRPHIAEVLRALFGHANLPATEWGDLRELPTRGLPPGSFAFRLPSIEQMTRNAAHPASAAPEHGARPAHPAHPAHGPAAHTPPQPPMEVLMVPDGQNVQIVMAADARALYTRFHDNTTPGVPAEAIAPAGAVMTMAFVLAGMPNLLRATSEHDAQEMAQAISHLSDQGRTPITMQFDTAHIDGGVRASMDLDVGTAALRGYFGLLTRQSAGSTPAAPPVQP